MPRGVTEQDVFEAADQLLARGERPTIERVRQALGTGSPNTVNRLLDVWWASLSKRMAGRDEGALPAAVLELCGRLYKGMHEQAYAESRSVVDGQLAAVEQARRTLDLEKTTVAAERLSLQSLSDALRQDLAKTAEENAVLRADLSSAAASQTAAEHRLAQLSAEHQQLTQRIVEAQAASMAEIDRVREQWEGNERRWLREIDQLRSDLKAAHAIREKELKSANQRARDAQDTLAERGQQVERLKTELVGIERQLAEERQARVAAQSELHGIRRVLSKSSRAPAKSIAGTKRRARSGP
jgi:chromosome segregation ATPase